VARGRELHGESPAGRPGAERLHALFVGGGATLPCLQDRVTYMPCRADILHYILGYSDMLGQPSYTSADFDRTTGQAVQRQTFFFPLPFPLCHLMTLILRDAMAGPLEQP